MHNSTWSSPASSSGSHPDTDSPAGTPAFQQRAPAASEHVQARLDHLSGSLDTLHTITDALSASLDHAGRRELNPAPDHGKLEAELLDTRVQLEASQRRERRLAQEVGRLQAIMEASALQHEIVESRLHQQLATSRMEAADACHAAGSAEACRDEALEQLSEAIADMTTLEASVIDSTAYVQILRAEVLDLKMQNCVAASRAALAEAQAHAHAHAAHHTLRSRDKENEAAQPGQADSKFTMASTTQAIRTAVEEASRLGEPDRSKRLRALQARWHPDKHSELREFASEVSKIINSAIDEMVR